MKKFFSALAACLTLLTLPPVHAQNIPTDAGAPPAGSAGIPLPQSSTPQQYNYTRTWVPKDQITSTAGLDINSSACQVSTTYTNGWGQPVQATMHMQVADIITPYDNRAMLNKPAYLPYAAGSSGVRFQPGRFQSQKAWYAARYGSEGDNAYSRTESKAAGNSRSTVAYGPGAALTGSGRGTTASAEVNTAAVPVQKLIDNPGGPNIVRLGTYAPGELVVQKTEGQHGALSFEYTNKSGQTVCKRVAAGNNTFLTTYYVYDDMGRIVWVITPKAVEATNGWNWMSAVPLTLCYGYKYNRYGQVIERTIPGKDGPELTVYDSRHRPVLSQTPLLRAAGKWAWQVYDARGRVAFSGFTTLSNTRAGWQALVDGGNAGAGTLGWYLTHECHDAYPATLADCEINEYSYYDSYGFPAGLSVTGHTFDTRHTAQWTAATAPKPMLFAQGLLTAKRTRVLGNAALPNQWVSTIMYYDYKGRPIQTQTLNAWNTTAWDVSTMRYNTDGSLHTVISDYASFPGAHKPSTRITDIYGYDLSGKGPGRLLGVYRKMDNGGSFPMSVSTYDELGRVKTKTMGNVETQEYSYDIAGRLTGINAAYVDVQTTPDVTFGCRINYAHGFSEPRYDGSVSGIIWRGAGSAAPQRAYGYTYDGAGRMAGADFVERGISGSLAAAWDNSHSDFTVSNLTYDANGNILTMKQRGNAVVSGTVQPVTMDDLSYSYQPASNTLDKVEDAVSANYSLNDFLNGHTATTDYGYDADGNLQSDANKGVTLITYNPQDLPTEVQGTGGQVANTYDASGSLLEKKITPATGSPVTYRYIGPMVFKDDDVEYALHSEGRARWLTDSLAWRYDYFVKDHLGNVRTIVTKDEGVAAQYLVTYENDHAQTERSIFEKVDEVREDKDAVPGGAVALPGSTDTKAALLDGADPDRRIGTSLLLKVMAGDKFRVGVEAAYDPAQSSENGETVGGEDMVSGLIAALSGTAGGTYVPGMEGGDMSPDLINGLLGGGDFLTGYSGLKADATDPLQPKAYLSYVLLDEEMHVVKEESGVLQVGAANAGAWGPLQMAGEQTIGKNGYLVVFLGCEDMVRRVGMDNLLVTYSRGRLLEEQHYYPHGLVAVDGSNNPLANRYLYQGKEMQSEAGLQLYDFHARQYDPQIGRFWGIDPMDEFPSGYTGMGNDPANLTDPTGMSTNWEPRSAPIQMGFGYSSPGTYDDGGMTDGAFDFDGTEVSTWGNSGAYGLVIVGGQGNDYVASTSVYNDITGHYINTIKDNLPNVTTVIKIDPSMEKLVADAINGLNNESEEEKRAGATAVRANGQNYDTDGFSAWFDKAVKSVRATKIGPDNIQGADIYYNGKPVTVYAEVSNNLRLDNGIIKVGTIKNGTYNDAQSSPNSFNLPSEPGKIYGIGIHLHPVSVNTSILNRSRPAPLDQMGSFGGGFNYDDRNSHSNQTYRSVTVDAQNIYLYNKSGPKITIRRR